jgi:hypothetical protein
VIARYFSMGTRQSLCLILIGWMLFAAPSLWGQEPEDKPPQDDPAQEETQEETQEDLEAEKPAQPLDDLQPLAEPLPWLEQMILSSLGRARMEVLFGDAEGRELRLVTLAPYGEAASLESDLPGLLIIGDGPEQRRFMDSVANPAEGRARELCARVVVYFLPEMGADFGGEDRIRFDRDFPVGWFPGPLRAGAGKVPLARADSLALSQLLQRQRNIVSILRSPAAGQENIDTTPWSHPKGNGDAFGEPIGCADQYAWHSFGVPTFGIRAGDDAEILQQLEFVPRLGAVVTDVLSLGDGQWQVDLELRNKGHLPTSFHPASGLQSPPGLSLQIEGVSVVAAACGEAVGNLAVARGQRLESLWRLGLEPLAGGGQRRIRLIVEAPENAELVATVDGARAQSLRLGVPLVP